MRQDYYYICKENEQSKQYKGARTIIVNTNDPNLGQALKFIKDEQIFTTQSINDKQSGNPYYQISFVSFHESDAERAHKKLWNSEDIKDITFLKFINATQLFYTSQKDENIKTKCEFLLYSIKDIHAEIECHELANVGLI